MSKISFQTFFLLLVFCLTAGVAQAATNLAGYWTFDGGLQNDGTNDYFVADVGAGHNGVLYGAYDFVSQTGANMAGTALPSGNYLQFSNNGYAVIENTANRGDYAAGYQNTFDSAGGPFSISLWVNAGDAPSNSWEVFVAKYGENNYGYQLRRHSTNSGPSFTIRRNLNPDGPAPATNFNLYDSNWHHLVGVYGNGYRELYMDNQLVYRIADTNNTLGGEGEHLVFGALENASAAYAMQNYSNAALDNVSYFTGALSPTQITSLYNGTAADAITTDNFAAKKASFSLSGTNYGPAADNFLASKLLAAKGAESKLTSNWMEGTKFVGDATDHLRTTDAANTNVTASAFDIPGGSFSVSSWFKLDHLNGDQALFGIHQAGGLNTSAHFIVRNGSLLMGFYSNDLAGPAVNANEWYHVTYSYDADAGQKTIYLNGAQVVQSGTNTGAFAGNAVMTLGTALGSQGLSGNMFGFQVSNQAVKSNAEAESLMSAVKASYVAANHYDAAEWYNGAGSGIFINSVRGGRSLVHSYNNPTGSIYDMANADGPTGMVWGPQFVVEDDSANMTFEVTANYTKLPQELSEGKYQFTSRLSGGSGYALWDMTTGDYVRGADGKIQTATHTDGTSTTGGTDGTTSQVEFSLAGLKGHEVMVVGIDRQAASWAWTGLVGFSTDFGAVSPITSAAGHHALLKDYHFDTAGDFHGWYEADASGAKVADDITHFTLGNRGADGLRTQGYIDNSGTLDSTKGFLSSGHSTYGEENATGILRSKPFLLQGDILEFLISGGDTNLAFEVVNAKSNEVMYSATGERSNTFGYDFVNIKPYENTPVYLRVRDEATGSWAHLELDQVRTVMFAPTQAVLDALAAPVDSTRPELGISNPAAGYLLKTFDAATVGSLTELSDAIAGGVVNLNTVASTVQFDGTNQDVFGAAPGVFAMQAEALVNMEYSGLYTLAVDSDDYFRLLLDGSLILEGGPGEFLETLYIDEAGWFDLELQYANQSGLPDIELLATLGAVDSLASGNFAPLVGFTGQATSAIPEPGSWLLMAMGAVGLALIGRRRRKPC